MVSAYGHQATWDGACEVGDSTRRTCRPTPVPVAVDRINLDTDAPPHSQHHPLPGPTPGRLRHAVATQRVATHPHRHVPPPSRPRLAAKRQPTSQRQPNGPRVEDAPHGERSEPWLRTSPRLLSTRRAPVHMTVLPDGAPRRRRTSMAPLTAGRNLMVVQFADTPIGTQHTDLVGLLRPQLSDTGQCHSDAGSALLRALCV